MLMTPHDEQTASEDVIEFFRDEDDIGSIYSNVKKAATHLWSTFMQYGSKTDRDQDTFSPGPIFEESIQFMVSKLCSENLLEKELGMYLFCENRVYVNRCKEVKEKMPEIISAHVLK